MKNWKEIVGQSTLRYFDHSHETIFQQKNTQHLHLLLLMMH